MHNHLFTLTCLLLKPSHAEPKPSFQSSPSNQCCNISENTKLHKTVSLQSGSSRHWRGCSHLRAYASNWYEENSMWLHCAVQPTCTFIRVQGSKLSLKHLCCCVFKVTSLLLSIGAQCFKSDTALKCIRECTTVSVKYIPSVFCKHLFLFLLNKLWTN